MVLLTYQFDVTEISYKKGKLINESNTVINITINNSEIEVGGILAWTPLSFFKYDNGVLYYEELEMYITLKPETNRDFIASLALEDYSKRILGIIRSNGPDRRPKHLYDRRPLSL